MIDFEDTLQSIVADATGSHYLRDPETFYASHAGYCLRQLYLAKLGLRDTTDLQGSFQAGTLIQQYFGDQVADRHPNLEVEATMTVETGSIQLVGRCDCFDPIEGVVYDIKTRSNWYGFEPPVDRHVDQLHVYMRGLDTSRGKLVYVSKTDLADVRTWPARSISGEFVQYNHDRFDRIVGKAEAIREEIITNGIATSADEVPFDRCDCFLCETEALQFPELTPTSKRRPPDLDYQDETRTSQDGSATAQPTTPHQSEGPKVDPISERVTEGTGDLPQQAGGETVVVDTDTYHVPAGLREFDIWVVWDCREKLARAPWQEGTMYPCGWAADKPVDPRRSYKEAKMVADLPVSEIHASWPFPNGDDLPETVEPAVLLPHDPPDPPIAFVDFDDVRDPDTGEVSSEVSELLDLLNGYTELSRSNTGLHVYVRGALPDGFGRFISPLAGPGHIELYDHSRFTGGTWRHVDGTPLDEIPDAQGAIDQIITTYASEAEKRRLSRL